MKVAPQILSKYVGATGGGTVYAESARAGIEQAYSRAIGDARNQYTLGYKPTNPKSAGGYRTIKVDAHAPGYKRLMVRTRSGYYPGQERAAK